MDEYNRRTMKLWSDMYYANAFRYEKELSLSRSGAIEASNAQ